MGYPQAILAGSLGEKVALCQWEPRQGPSFPPESPCWCFLIAYVPCMHPRTPVDSCLSQALGVSSRSGSLPWLSIPTIYTWDPSLLDLRKEEKRQGQTHKHTHVHQPATPHPAYDNQTGRGPHRQERWPCAPTPVTSIPLGFPLLLFAFYCAFNWL